MALTTNERNVYSYVREQAKQGLRPTIDEVARATGVPRSSVGRSARALGYAGWTDFTTQLRDYYTRSCEGNSGVVEDSVRIVCDMLHRSHGHPVMVDAVGDAGVLADYLIMRLCDLGYWAAPYTPLGLEHCHERDGVLLVLNESGMALLPACLTAHESGLEVIAITASHDTPVSKVADVNIVIKNQKSTTQSYRPNYFTTGSLALFERVFAQLEAQEDSPDEPRDPLNV